MGVTKVLNSKRGLQGHSRALAMVHACDIVLVVYTLAMCLYVLSTICLNMNWKAYKACNFNFYVETSEGHRQWRTL